jgi:microsomal epoxide hydrolase
MYPSTGLLKVTTSIPPPPFLPPLTRKPGFPTSIYPYRALFGGGPRKPFPYVAKPTGYSFFPAEISPGIRSAAEKAGNLVYYKQHETGGHFAALERPKELWGDVEAFAGEVWKEGGTKL